MSPLDQQEASQPTAGCFSPQGALHALSKDKVAEVGEETAQYPWPREGASCLNVDSIGHAA